MILPQQLRHCRAESQPKSQIHHCLIVIVPSRPSNIKSPLNGSQGMIPETASYQGFVVA
jgi:hypothetical protein